MKKVFIIERVNEAFPFEFSKKNLKNNLETGTYNKSYGSIQ